MLSIANAWRRLGIFPFLVQLCLIAGSCFAAEWDGPTWGPRAVGSKTIIFIAQDFRNGGITAVFREFQSATLTLGWHVDIVDGAGSDDKIRRVFADAINSHPDGILLGGFDESDIVDLVPPHCSAVLIGWHATANPGPTAHLFANITTDPIAVADMATDYLIRTMGSRAGVVIFSDSRFDIARAKARHMDEKLRRCSSCTVLAIDNVLISEIQQRVPAEIKRLNAQFGHRWTHTLAVNDAYFDSSNVPLATIGRHDIVNISAGDGSLSAQSRIRSGASQQVASIAEPAGIQGWQMADEFNRSFAGAQASGYVSRPVLVTTASLRALGSNAIDSDIPYRQAYMAIWQLSAPAP